MTIESQGSPAASASDLDLFEQETDGGQSQAHKSDTTPDLKKYEGKTVDDLIKMNQEQARFIGRQSQEIGNLRRVSDQLLDLKKPTTETKKEELRQPVTVDALLSDPDKALHSAVNSSEVAARAARAEDRVAALETNIARDRFTSKHKNFADDLANPDFISWTQANKVRATLASHAAAAQPNFEAAEQLWDLWDEHKQLTSSKPGPKPGQQGKKVPSTVKAGPSENTNEAPIYSRIKLAELRAKVQQGDPVATERWKNQEFQNRLIQAYQDDRVR